jgi:adenylyl-sulfate kinase
MKDGFVVWMTGLPGSGKTTIAVRLAEELRKRGRNVEIMDGDEVRKNISPELGFSKEDREAHVKRVAYISKLLARNGVGVIVGLISPYRETREYARKLIGDGFSEVYIKCPVEVCQKRDPKGLYRKALAGEITDFTGVQDPYEPPLNPELIVETDKENEEESVAKIIGFLKERGKL